MSGPDRYGGRLTELSQDDWNRSKGARRDLLTAADLHASRCEKRLLHDIDRVLRDLLCDARVAHAAEGLDEQSPAGGVEWLSAARGKLWGMGPS